MTGIDNFDKIKERYQEYWAKENHDRPLMDIRAFKHDYRTRIAEYPGSLKERWMDTEYVLKKTVELTKAILDDSRGDYLVGITDIHPGMDGLVSLRGPEELCFDLYEDPETVKEKNFQYK